MAYETQQLTQEEFMVYGDRIQRFVDIWVCGNGQRYFWVDPGPPPHGRAIATADGTGTITVTVIE